jgi:hypothetical protein
VGKSRLFSAKTTLKLTIVAGLLELFGGTSKVFLLVNPSLQQGSGTIWKNLTKDQKEVFFMTT